MSTDCEEPYCINEPCLMDYGPDFIGNWQDVYNENNKKANRELLLGILSVIFALLIVGFLFFNYYIFFFSKKKNIISSFFS